jgi:outer membrane usher protein
LSGSLAAMDGTVLAARRVGRGFALVSTGVPGLPVMHENREIGRTGADGRLLVPDLMPYAGNQIAIDPSNLPADARIASTSLEVVPQAGAGLVAAFHVERYRAATVIVQDAEGKPLPPGTPVTRPDGKPATVVGYDGVVFLDGLDADNEIVAGEGAGACSYRFAWRAGTEGQLPSIGPLRCTAGKPAPTKENP